MANEFFGASERPLFDGLEGKHDPKNTDVTRTALAQAAFAPSEENHLRNLGTATGIGLAGGAAGSAATDIAVTKLVAEPIANGAGRALHSVVESFAGRSLTYAPVHLKLSQCINPRRAVIGAVTAAAILAAGYEVHHRLNASPNTER